jgi:hypothetical protein
MYPTAWRSAIPFLLFRGLAVPAIALWLCLGFTVSSCQNGDGTNDASRPTHINPANKHLAKYYHLVGQMDSMVIRLDLQEELGMYADDQRYFRGFYHYEQYGGPISVYGTLDAKGNLKLTEQGAAEGESHYFAGQWDDKGTYTGHWHHGNGKDRYAFRLAVQTEHSTPFTKYVYMDSLVAFAEWTVSPQLYYSAEWLEVGEDSRVDAATRQFIRQQMVSGLLDTVLKKPTDDIMPLLVNRRDFLYADFLDNMGFMRKTQLLDSTTTNPADFLSVNYTYNTLVQVYYNTRDLLSLGFTDYYYTGGAHGMYTTRVATYDLKRRRPLTPDDVLLPGYNKAVSQALGQAVRTKYNLPASSPLTAVLFENRVAPNGNFGLTHKGIFFVYAPYEIAPYSEGELTLFVAFDNIKEYVRPEWLPQEE